MINAQMMPSMLPMVEDEPLLIPKMTSNTAPSGFLVTTNIVGIYEPVTFWVFDGILNNTWAPSMADMPWVQLELPRAVRVLGYKISSGVSGGSRSPRNWTLQGSNGGAFTTIDTRTEQTGWSSSGETRSFAVASPGDYTRYRLNISANNGDSICIVSELELLQAL